MTKKTYIDIYDNPPIRDEELESFYMTSDEYLDDLNGHDKVYLKNYINFVSKYLKENQKVLDLGCGNGSSTHLLSSIKKGLLSIGCDISFKFLSSRKGFKSNNIKFAVANAINLPFRDETMDVVCSFQLIEHIIKVENAIAEMARVVKRGGVIIIISPNLLSPFPPLKAILSKNFKYLQLRGKNKDVFRNIQISIRNLFITLDKIKSKNVRFLFRKPNLSADDLGHDLDSVYLANQVDIKKFLEIRGFKIINIAIGMSFAGEVVSRLLPSFSGEFAIVAKKV